MAKIAVVYHSSTGHVHQLALAVQAGAEEAGAEVRLRRAPELAPETPMPHAIDPRVLPDVQRWLAEVTALAEG